jgi:predicted permease
VLPENFRFLDLRPAMLLPFRLNRAEVFVGQFSYEGVARLKPGVTIEQANADVARMLPMMVHKFRLPPGFSMKMLEQAKIGPNLYPFHRDLVGDLGNVLWVLMGTVGIVLLIACANVANLFLVRAEARQQELAVRAALGAGSRRIARELLSESVLLGVLGGAIGLVLAYGGIRLLVWLAPSGLPRLDEIAIDPVVLAFTAGVSIVAGLLFGFIPALKYSGAQLSTALKQGGRTSSEGRERHRARGVLVVVQVALALVLLVSSGLMIRTFQALRSVQPGFTDPAQVLTLRLSIPEAQVKDGAQVTRTHEQILRKLEQLPGVTSVALSSSITMDGNNSNDPIFVEERPSPEGQIPPLRRFKWISPGFFKTMGTPLVAGRDYTWTDIYNKAPLVIVSENFARAQFGDPAQAIGKRVRESPKSIWREIVGVVGDARDDGVNRKAPEIMHWPMMMSQFWSNENVVRRNIAYAIRSPRVGSGDFMNEVRQTIWSVNPNLPLASVRTLKTIHDRSMARTSFTLVMLGIAGAMALLLGVVGIYGVIAYSVSQRTREIGIRMALGAQREDVRGMFVRHGLLLTGTGVAVGLAAAFGLTRLMSKLLYGVSAVDPLTYIAVAAGLIGATLLASYLPARRATNIDPVTALRNE